MSKKHIHGICPLLPGVCSHCCNYCHHCNLQTCGTPYHLCTGLSSIVILFKKPRLHTVFSKCYWPKVWQILFVATEQSTGLPRLVHSVTQMAWHQEMLDFLLASRAAGQGSRTGQQNRAAGQGSRTGQPGRPYHSMLLIAWDSSNSCITSQLLTMVRRPSGAHIWKCSSPLLQQFHSTPLHRAAQSNFSIV